MLAHSEVDVFCFLLVITLAPLLNFNTCKIRFRKWAWPHEQGIPIRNWLQEAGFGKGVWPQETVLGIWDWFCKIRFRKWAWPFEQGIPIRNWFQEVGLGKKASPRRWVWPQDTGLASGIGFGNDRILCFRWLHCLWEAKYA